MYLTAYINLPYGFILKRLFEKTMNNLLTMIIQAYNFLLQAVNPFLRLLKQG